ncbi:potassium:proton antiporter [bacterium]|nr:MAG: potassium:proton antiporter [bacterium]
MPSIRESNLPGVGHKFQIETASGDRLTIVIHDDGRRELYHFDANQPDRVVSVVTLQDSEARQIAGIIGGLTYVPKALPSAELLLDDLVLEWFTIPQNAFCVSKTIRDLGVRTQTGASIVSIIRESRHNILNPEADTLLEEGTTLVVAGDRKTIGALKRLLTTGSTS